MDVVQSTCEKKLFQILGGSVGENRGKWEAVFHWFQYGGSADNEIHIELPNEEFHFHIKLLYEFHFHDYLLHCIIISEDEQININLF
jgi:hypothetical protein